MNADALKRISREDWQPFTLPLGAGELEVQQCLRLLPGKRMACQALHGDTRVFAKLCFAGDHRRTIAREADALRCLSEAGVRVPAVAGVFEQPGVTVLLLQWLPEAMPLADLPVRDWSDGLAADFFQQLAGMFAAGLVQADLHLGNFIVTPAGVYVVDAGDIEKAARLSVAKRRNNLALLCAQAPLADQHHLQALVLEHLGEHVDSADKLQAAVHDTLMGRIRHANGKWLRDCTAVHVVAVGGALCCLDRTLDADSRSGVMALLDDPSRGEVVKQGSRISVYRHRSWIIKHYRQASLKTRIKQWLGIHPSQRSWRFGWTWHLLGLPTPRPVGLRLSRNGSAVIVFPYQPGERYSEILEYRRDQGDLLRPILEQDLAAMGNANLWHGDVKAQNILVSASQAYWIDLDAAGWSKRNATALRKHRRDVQRFARNWEQFLERDDDGPSRGAEERGADHER